MLKEKNLYKRVFSDCSFIINNFLLIYNNVLKIRVIVAEKVRNLIKYQYLLLLFKLIKNK